VLSERGTRVSLQGVLDAFVTSESFERLMLARERPILARAGAGEDFVIAGLAPRPARGGPRRGPPPPARPRLSVRACSRTWATNARS
jgi:hypothetical protein